MHTRGVNGRVNTTEPLPQSSIVTDTPTVQDLRVSVDVTIFHSDETLLTVRLELRPVVRADQY